MIVKDLVKPEKLEGPLKGIRVVDFTHILAGPYVTSLLADLGANIIKIERLEGDAIRRFGPFRNGESGYYVQLNRGKRSIAMNLRHKKSKDIIKRMVENSDVVIENFMPKAIERLGYGYDVLSKWNPRIIMCSVSVNGQYGPEFTAPGFDLIAQARGGIMSVTGFPDNPPTKIGPSLGDMNCGSHTAVAVLAAVYEREKSGKGQYIDMSMSDCVLRVNEFALPYYDMMEKNPPRSGNAHPAAGPCGAFKTKDDKWLALICVSDLTWKRFLDATGHPEWNDDPRFNSISNRGTNRYALQDIIDAWFAQYTMEEAMELFKKNAVPHSLIFSFSDIAANEQFLAREMVVTVDQPKAGKTRIAGNVFKYSRTPCKVQGRTALLGENNEEVLKEFGYSDDDIKALYDEKAIAKPLL
jgi:crotonobetainyl-CoA:carnitine CoA-transferase CaiB-like acyl-CoA transferase